MFDKKKLEASVERFILEQQAAEFDEKHKPQLGLQLDVQSSANLSNTNTVKLKTAEWRPIEREFEAYDLVNRYAHCSDRRAIVAKASKVIATNLKKRKLSQLRDIDRPVILHGVAPSRKYKPRSYVGRTKGRKMDPATSLGGLLADALIHLRGGQPVHVQGVHDVDDPSHTTSIVAVTPGQENKLASGSVLNFPHHGDGDGNVINAIDDLILVGQVHDGFQPTYYSGLKDVLDFEDKDKEAFLTVLEQPYFRALPPATSVSREAVSRNVGRPIISASRTILNLHPTTEVLDDLPTNVKAEASRALQWLRWVMDETSIGVSLQAFQILILPNRHVKHAVKAKRLNADGTTLRQLLRVYGTRSFRDPNSEVFIAPNI